MTRVLKAVIFDMYETLITLFESRVYFSTQMAEDAGIPEEDFRKIWRGTEEDRTTGRARVEEVVARILKEKGCFTEEKLRLIMEKRIRYKKEAFSYMHPEILPMMDGLQKAGIKIGLISNCHSEEAAVIQESILYPYFDAVCLSWEEGIQKPDRRIFERVLQKLAVSAQECLYVGDGGSNELAAAESVGMHPAQAVWYLKEGAMQPVGRMEAFAAIEKPLDVIEIVQKYHAVASPERDRRK